MLKTEGGLASVSWENVVSDHGAATALNRLPPGNFIFLFVFIHFMSSCA